MRRYRYVLMLLLLALSKIISPGAGFAQTGESTNLNGDYCTALPATDLERAEALQAVLAQYLPGTAKTAESAPTVQVVYLVPSDRVENLLYAQSLDASIRHLQAWYHTQVPGGATFTLADPAVRTLRSTHPEAWYREHNAQNGFTTFYGNAIDDALALMGRNAGDAEHIWLIYPDADAGCGQCGGCGAGFTTGGGFAVISANDHRGFLGGPWVQQCEGSVITFGFRPCRFVGGMGHELGHAFGLGHTCDRGQAGCGASIMDVGFYGYPNAPLDAFEQQTLRTHPFFTPQTFAGPLPNCDAFVSFDVPHLLEPHHGMDARRAGADPGATWLVWGDLSFAASYDVEVARNVAFSNMAFRTTLADRFVRFVAVGDGSTQDYFWRVRRTGEAAWSEVRRFSIMTVPITGTITFQVDMSREKRLGHLPAGEVVGVRGNTAPLSWTETTPLTDADGDGVFSGTVGFTLAPATTLAYQFVRHKSNGNDLVWEYGTQGGSTRTLTFNGEATLPPVFWSNVTGVATDQEVGSPADFALHPNYPNPFYLSTQIRYDVATPGHVRLTVIDLLGREIDVLVDELTSAGQYEVTWNAAGVPSGVYMYRLQMNENHVASRRLLLLR